MDCLRIGDYITLKTQKYDSFMLADGILVDNPIVAETSNIDSFEDCLFCIYYQRQYSAARELEEFTEANVKSDGTMTKADTTQKYMKALRRGRDNENKLNDTYQSQKRGTPIVFGDTVQLLHVKSGKFLTIIPDKLASHERENMVVTLTEMGSVFSWIQILPRYKIDREGDKVLTNTEVVLKVSERPNEFVHCSDKTPPQGIMREVNCSLEQSAWKLSAFQTVKESTDPSLLLTSQLVVIHDPETRSNIQIVQDKDGDQISYKIAIQPSGNGVEVDSMSLWVIESKTQVDGGTIQWKSDQIRFRSLNTGMYLAVKSDSKGKDSGRGAELCVFGSAASCTLFTLHEMYSSTFFLATGKAMQICHNNSFVERGEYDDTTGSYMTSLTSEKSRAVSLLIHRYVQTLKRNEVEVGEAINETEVAYTSTIPEPVDVYVGVAAARYLNRYIETMIIPTTDFSAGTLWPRCDRSTFYEVISVIKKINLFVRGLKVSEESELQIIEGKSPVKIPFRRARQAMALEQGVVGQVLHMLEMLIPLSQRTEGMGPQSKAFLNKSDQEKSIIRICEILVSQLFNLLYNCLEGNSRTQIYVADSMPVLLAYVATQSSASKCVTEMLSTNMELQETKIGAREINIFIDKLRESKMNCMYLDLLKACCSCMGRAIDNNQGTIAESLFDDVSDIIIQIHPDRSRLQKVEWDAEGKHLFVPTHIEAGSPMFGQDLVERGVPQLSLSWTTKSIDYSPLGLFGRLSVNIMDLYPGRPRGGIAESGDWKRPSKSSASASHVQKQAVADYFISELFLAAEMCLGRNYVAMQKLEMLFPYEVLVTIMKLDVSEALKAAATRLMLCLYVDREPQIVATVPCLTRAWSEIAKSGVPQLPNVEVARKNQFSLLQQMISEHVKDMQGRRWEELSVSIMLLLKHLIMFNFYGTKEKLQDVIEPLIQAIDRRKVEVDEGVDQILAMLAKSGNNKRKLMKQRTKLGAEDRSLSLKQITVDNSIDFMEEGKEADGSNTNILDASEVPKESNDLSWQRRVLTFLESLPVMAAVVLLVFVAITVAVIQTVNGSTAVGYKYFDIIVTFIFCFEVSLRLYCYIFVKNEVLSFFKNVLNDIDIVVVCIDLVILGMPSGGSQQGVKFFKALRAARLIRLVRVLRAARVVQKLRDLTVKTYDAWKMPIRYVKTPRHELDTMVEAVNILSFVQQIIEDRNLSLLLQGFQKWQLGQDTRSPGEIFESVINDSTDLTLNCAIFDEVFIDILMFAHVDLVQVALDVLMAHHSARLLLFNNAQKTQLLVSPQRERQLKTIRNMLRELERNAETHELWGELETEEDQRINKQTFEHMYDLIQMCRTRCKVLEFDEDYKPDLDIQNLLRNLGFFQISLKILGLIPSLNNGEGEEDEISINTRNLIRTCNDLLYWFLNNNPNNQVLGFGELEFFLSCIDMRINAHRVIHAIFKNNEHLMRACPRQLIEQYSEKVCKLGRQPQFLAILSSVTHVRDKNILENQYEIVKHLMAPGRTKKMTRFCGGKDDPEYEERVELMAPFVGKGDVTIEELPTELGYHLEFLRVLSGCTVGRINITTVEAKVQSVYDYRGMLYAMMDERTISLAKTRLGLLLYNAMIEVEINVGGLGTDTVMWTFITETKLVFKKCAAQLKLIEEKGWEMSRVPRQDIEFMVVCAMIVAGFFAKYFDLSNFENFSRDEKPTMTTDEVQEIMMSVFTQLYGIYDMKCTCISPAQKGFIANALDAMQRYSPKLTSLYPSIDSLENPMAVAEQNEGEEEGESVQAATKAVSIVTEETIDVKISHQFDEFVKQLQEDEELKNSIKTENRHFVETIDSLPFLADNVEADVRYEPLIRKLVSHVRDRLQTIGNEKHLDARCTQTTTWIIRSFRTMIETRWGMSIYERDDDGGEEEDIAAAPIVNALNSCGATTLCLDLISVGIDAGLMLESVKLCVAMLFLEGGNLPVQQTMFNYLKNIKSDLFFQQMRLSIQSLISWHKWHDVIILGEDQEVDLPEDIIVVRFLQLMCEGHYQCNQDIMREQPSNSTSVNLLDDFVQYLNCLSRIPCKTSTDAASRISATILEVIQGPCEKNQEHFALQTELIETLNRIIRAKTIRDCDEDSEVDLKKTAIDILQGLLEGQGGKTAVYDRVLSVVHLDAIQMMSQPEEKRRLGPDESGEEEEEKPESEEVVVLRVECLVLLQMLCDYRPSLREELEIDSDKIAVKGVSVACVEILWNGELQRRFFHVPKICSDLAKASKDALVENVNRSNQENKLLDYLLRSRELYREIKHQQVLKEYRVSGIFSRANQDRATWFSLFLACAINAILIADYSLIDGKPTLSPNVSLTVNAMNIFQIAFSSFTLMLFLVVRVPVKYQSNLAAGMDSLRAVLYACSDPLTLYYVFYLVMSIMGYNVSYFFLTVLLLDILVKNSTARDILMAVVYPRKQLFMTYVLTVFVVYIFAFIVFMNYRNEFLPGQYEDSCKNLFSCFKICLGNAFRSDGGIGDYMDRDLEYRYIMDTLYFVCVLIVLLNVMFGIVIDTFGNLRTAKAERLADTTGNCFICGIDKQIFDRAADGVQGFSDHIKRDHNMWNYLYFIIYIWEQDKDDDDGLEQFVRRSMEINDINWFPMNKAMRLDVAQSDEDILLADLKEDIAGADSKMSQKLSAFQAEVSATLAEISRSIVQDTGVSVSEAGFDADSPTKDMLTGLMSRTQSFIDGMREEAAMALGGGTGKANPDDDSDTEEEVSLSTVEHRNPQHWKRLVLTILDIKGLVLSEKDKDSISCRIISDSGMFSANSTAITPEKVTFENEQIPICDRAGIDDTRALRIQILQGSGRVAKFIGIVDMSYEDLIGSTELVYEKIFTQSENPKPCVLSLYPVAIDIKT